MRKVNHVRCTNHFVQLVVLKVLTFIKEPTEQLRDVQIRICRNKVMRQQYRIEAAVAGFANKEPTHQDSPTRWSSTHEMCTNASGKLVILDSIMDQYAADIGHGTPLDLESRAAPGHGEPCSRSQVDARPGADVHVSTPEALRRQRAETAGDRRQADDGQNEGEAREV
ncbi:unnamed protein product [Sphagnum tenellum]